VVTERALRSAIFCFAYLTLWSSAGHALELSSPDVVNGARLKIAQVHARCGGENHSPGLAWSGAPKGTASYAVTIFDSDANGGRGFWHWIVFDIPSGTSGLPTGAGSGSGLPAGALQPDNDFGTVGYGGACPPPGSGTHHYTLTLYALSAPKLPLDNGTASAAVAAWLRGHAMATATLTGTYSR